MKKMKARETEFFEKVMKNEKLCKKFWQQRLQTWMTTHAQKFKI